MKNSSNHLEINVFPNKEVVFKDHHYTCALGRSGIGKKQKEGDGLTPLGTFALREVFYRADCIGKPKTNLPVHPISKDMGWCDDPNSKEYNKKVNLPFEGSHENLWRDDRLYDLIVVVSYNDDPVIPNKGSAIFLHVAKSGYQPTEGCVAFALDDLRTILKDCSNEVVLKINSKN
ncbi:MAG: L,D-transpeptidase family protein [Alphaproteobacteria bacterium]|nr:L,D-transpeptidase family protein [Alphaproteobacteria bacterium]